MNWQQVFSLMIVAVAASALIWGRFRRRQFRFGRDTHCGCASSPPTIGQGSILFHVRKGERPQVRVK